MISRPLSIFVTLFVLSTTLQAQTFDASISDPALTTNFIDVACRDNGDAVILGEMMDGNFSVEMIVALQPGGQTRWIRSYPNGVNNFFDFNHIIASPDERLNIFGSVLDIGPPFNGYDPMIMKTDSAGQALWAKQYSGAYTDYPGNFRITHDGGFIACGMSMNQANTNSYYFLLKTDSAGNREWGKLYHHPFFDKISMNDVLEDANGDYIACGHIDDTALVMKVSHGGNFRWMKKLPFSSSFFTQPYSLTHSHRPDAFVCTGMSLGSSFALEIDSLGNVNWAMLYTYPNAGFMANDIATSPDGGYCLTGYQSAQQVNTSRGALLKIDSVGQIQWNRLYTTACGSPFAAIDTLHQVTGYTMAGMHFDSNCSNSYGYAVRTDIAGNLFCTEQAGTLVATAEAIKPIDLYPTVSDYFTQLEHTFVEQPYTYNDSTPCPSLGINTVEAASGNLAIRPLPASDHLTVELPGRGQWKVELIDITGRYISSETVEGQIFETSVAALPSGIYFIQASNVEKRYCAKFVKSDTGN